MADIIDQQEEQIQEGPGPKMNVKDFATKIKTKYPQYKDLDDTELTNRVIAKYPVYKDQVDFATTPTPVEKKNQVVPSKPSTGPSGPLVSQLPSQKETKKTQEPDQSGFPMAPINYEVISQVAKGEPLSTAPKPKPEKKITPLNLPYTTELTPEEKQKSLDNEARVEKEQTGNRVKYIYNEFIRNGIGRVSAGAADLIMQGITLLPEAVVGDTRENAIKQWRDQVTPKIKEGIVELAGADVSKSKEAQYNKEFFTSALGSLAGMAPMMVSGAIAPETLGYTVPAQFGLVGYDSGLEMINSTEEGRKLPESTKSIFGAAVGTANLLLMKANLDKILGNASEKVAKDLAIKTIRDLSQSGTKVTMDVFEQVLKQNAQGLKNKAIDLGGKLTQTAAHGFLFGTAMESSNQLLMEATNKLTEKQIFDPISWGDRVGQILESGAHLATGNLILGSVTMPFSRVRNYISQKVSEAKTQEDIDVLKSEVINSADKGDLRQDDINGLTSLIDQYTEISKKIPESIPQQNKKETIDIIFKRNELENTIKQKEEELKNIDIAFKPEAEQELNLLKTKFDDLNQEIINKSRGIVTEPEVISKPIELTIGTETKEGSVGVGGDVVKNEFTGNEVKNRLTSLKN